MMPLPDATTSSALDEETARSELYGLLAPVYYAQPAIELTAGLRAAATDSPAAGAFLEEPWRALVGVARDMTDAQIATEFDTLFGGVGKPEVYLYASHYLSGFLNEKPLARLRTDLNGLGLARDETMSETEDHIAYLFEVMRYLIAGDDAAVANLTQQQTFFAAHIQSWVGQLCDTLARHPKARFYAAVAELTRAFMNVEAQGFDMLA
ncbi:MAG: molecular chaperone TorD family protein [Rhodoferax sp.]|uniref:TorD/DmsD family molecular chaperone n=1 Tax=Rhodoferax sp. TaxID=50421 RepID=UPI00261BC054|nr:molecular chaperone TorD family protein [Rhodoferax sp.]MDD2880353.1 molecular chaperone TorD family protein [Rhodoferax sp.]